MVKSFDEIIAKVKEREMKTIAVAVAQDGPVLEAVYNAQINGIAKGILVGDKDKIISICKAEGIDYSIFQIEDIKDVNEATLEAVRIVSSGGADMLIKGLVDSKSFLRAVLNRDCGLRCGKAMSHVSVFETEKIDRLLLLTDVAFNTFPDLNMKADIIRNAVSVAHAIGIDEPKVAAVCAVEVVNEKMPNTIDAMKLSQMNRDGEINGCLVQGPLALDNAISKEAAHHKGIVGYVAGMADIVMLPDIESGNIMYKTLTFIANTKNACLLVGTKAPVVLTSRADSSDTKMYSIALASLVASYDK